MSPNKALRKALKMDREWNFSFFGKPKKPVPFPEVPFGCRVVFAHTWVCENLNKRSWYVPTFTAAIGPSKTLRQAVVCILKNGDVVYFGTSVCSPLDKFNSKIGRALALRRALHAMNNEAFRYTYYGRVTTDEAMFIESTGDSVLYRFIKSVLAGKQKCKTVQELSRQNVS